MSLLKVIRVLAKIVNQPDSNHAEHGIQKRHQEILDEVTVKNPEHGFSRILMRGEVANSLH
jgi:hypothetical protein